MNLTRKEAIEALKHINTSRVHPFLHWEEMAEVRDMAIAALRGPTREQVEKSWVGCEYCKKHKINLVRIEMNYNDSPGSPERLNPTRVPKFCPMCGRPLTDEAVEITMRRLEVLSGEAKAN